MIVTICIIFLMIVNYIRQQIFNLAFKDSLEERFASQGWRTLFWRWTRELDPYLLMLSFFRKQKYCFQASCASDFWTSRAGTGNPSLRTSWPLDLWLGSSLAGSFTALCTDCFSLFAYYLGLISLFIEIWEITLTRFICLLELLGMQLIRKEWANRPIKRHTVLPIVLNE